MEIYMTTFQEMYACFEQSSLVVPSKLEKEAQNVVQ